MWISRREWRRHARELHEAKARADRNEVYARHLVNSFLTKNGQSGIPLEKPAEKKYTPSPVLPNDIQGWTHDEFLDTLTADGTYKSRSEAEEVWQAAQRSGMLPYQRDDELVS